MSFLTTQPIGFYPDDRARVARIQAAHPELKNITAAVRYALREVDDRLVASAKRQKAPEDAQPGMRMVTNPSPTLIKRMEDAAGQPQAAAASDDEAAARARLAAAVAGRAHREVDRLAEVARGTTRNVLHGSSRLESAGGGRLLEWVVRVETA